MEGSRFRRLAENERLIRDANEEAELVAVDEAGRKAHLDAVEVEFFCACGRADCEETIVMSVAEYSSVHEMPNRFVVVPGHETPEIERVVERHDTYVVVEKKPEYR
ncbi:MAG TPA: hypothetical protein VE982_05780 [Gaiellaceae bacterium]|nr:hypothetical protein [Gaiellaceae bacterium]